jgi:predicted nucleotidyltransferase
MAAETLTRELVHARVRGVEADVLSLGVRRLALFGSVLRNEARPDSDVDLLVEFAPGQKSFDRFLALCELLESRLGHRVELVTTEALSPFLGPHILAEAADVVRAA